MILRDFIAQLLDFDMDSVVVVSSDAEGNDFRIVDDITDEEHYTIGLERLGRGRGVVIWP